MLTKFHDMSNCQLSHSSCKTHNTPYCLAGLGILMQCMYTHLCVTAEPVLCL